MGMWFRVKISVFPFVFFVYVMGILGKLSAHGTTDSLNNKIQKSWVYGFFYLNSQIVNCCLLCNTKKT